MYMSDCIDFIWGSIYEKQLWILTRFGENLGKNHLTLFLHSCLKFFLTEKCVRRWCELLALVFLTIFLHSHWHTHICFYAFTHKQVHTHPHMLAHTLSLSLKTEQVSAFEVIFKLTLILLEIVLSFFFSNFNGRRSENFWACIYYLPEFFSSSWMPQGNFGNLVPKQPDIFPDLSFLVKFGWLLGFSITA